MRLFADDVKIWTRIDQDDSSWSLQRDLYELCNWTNKWLLRFNTEKCKIMHIGHNMPTRYYLREGPRSVELQVIGEEKDLGVYTTANMKSSVQCSKAAAKATAVLRMINRNSKKISRQSFITLYKSYVRPHIEYCVQAWSPHLVSDRNCLEKIQRRATKMVVGLKFKPYEERLSALGLTTLEDRRRRGDLIETFKIMKGLEKVEYRDFFRLAPDNYFLRGHSEKLFVPCCRLNVRSKFFSQRVLKDWNSLPQHVIDADTTNTFRKRPDKLDMSN